MSILDPRDLDAQAIARIQRELHLKWRPDDQAHALLQGLERPIRFGEPVKPVTRHQVDVSGDELLDADSARGIMDTVLAGAREMVQRRDEEILSHAFGGRRLCIHPADMLRDGEFWGDTIKIAFRQKHHFLEPDEACDVDGRIEYTDLGFLDHDLVKTELADQGSVFATRFEPGDLYRNLVAAYEKLTEHQAYPPEPPRVATPAQKAAHEAAQDLPRARWIVVGDIWMDTKVADRPRSMPPQDAFGSLLGRRLLRTGRFTARPTTVGEPGGFDVGEYMVLL